MTPSQLLDDHRSLLRVGGAALVVERNRPAAQLVESFERLDQVAEKCVATLFAVGDNVEAGGFLERDGLVDRAVFDRLERGRRDRARFQLLARGGQIRRTEQAADRFSAALGY